MAAGTATGFLFSDYSALALGESLERACNTYAQTESWQRIVQRGMSQDWSWAASARQYVDVYQATLAGMRHTAAAGSL